MTGTGLPGEPRNFMRDFVVNLKRPGRKRHGRALKESDLDFSDSHTKKCSSCDDCVHTALSCNVGCFNIRCGDKPALVGCIGLPALIKEPPSIDFATQLSCGPSL